MRRAVWLILLSLLGPSGCAHAPAETLKLTQRIEELAQREAQAQKQVDELSNRLFLLEDKVDTGRVAMESSGKPPQLPVVRLQPTPEDRVEQQADPPVARRPAADDEEQGDEDGDDDAEQSKPAPTSVVSKRRVVFDGAARRGGPRPMLRLHEGSGGGSGGGGSGGGAALPGPDPMSVTEKLPVAPIPKQGSAKKVEWASAKKPELPAVQPMREYSEAMGKYKAGQYAAAAAAFRSFLSKYTKHAYADNALYWMGECAYDTKNYRLALKMFRQVVEDYPTGNKAPDALLKMAYCYLRLKEDRNARTVLAQVVESFPKSQVARLASETLSKM
jgi:tol-pal system protein YbgF